jgi:hypothetical protein
MTLSEIKEKSGHEWLKQMVLELMKMYIFNEN